MPAVRAYLVLAGLALGWAGSPAQLGAQEKPQPEAKDAPLLPVRFFDRPIDYWGRGLAYQGEKKPPAPLAAKLGDAQSKAIPAPSDWGQMVKESDGTITYRDLPRPLVDVLEDPSPEKIRAYFDWKLTRTEKILRAAQAMRDFKLSAGVGEGPEVDLQALVKGVGASPGTERSLEKAPPIPVGPLPKLPFTLTYFHRSGCSHCDTQDAILERWLKDKPEGKLVTIAFGEQSELWQKFHVRGTPSLVVEAAGSGRPVFLEGVSGESELSRALLESGAAGSKKALSVEGEKK